MALRIDSHQHFWNYDPHRHQWIDDSMASIRQSFLPADLLPHLRKQSLDGSVVVQVDQTEEENHFLLQLAIENEFIKGIVGWVDLRADNIRQRVEYFSEYSIVKGFRHIVQGEPDDHFMIRPDFLNGISSLSGGYFTYDILVYPRQLEAAVQLVSQFPDQKFVLDHIAKPLIKDHVVSGWEEYIRELGNHENVYCKVSGMVTEADWENWGADDFRPYLDIVVEAFGLGRLMYGSDWPVCNLAGGYKEVYNLVDRYFAQFTPEEQARFFGGTACEFYSLENM